MTYYHLPGLYRADGTPADLGDLIDADLPLDYWDWSVIGHVYRAGRKPGETKLEALENAGVCMIRAIRKERRRHESE